MNLGKALPSPLYRLIYVTPRIYAIRRSLISRALHLLLEPDPRLEMFDLAMKSVKWARESGLDGDYLEFGVCEGLSLATSYYWAKRRGLDSMKFYAFDSFQGLPSTKGCDAGSEFAEGQCRCDLARFKTMLSKMGVDLNRVVITPGWFNDVLNDTTKTKLGIKSAAVVFIDCDLYESTVPVLDFITDYLVDGTLLLFGAWFHFKGNPEKGQQRAVREWLSKKPGIRLIEYRKFGCHGNSFIVHRISENSVSDV